MKARDTYSILLGLFLLIEGVWGLFSPVVFGLFTTNILHAVIHLGLGIAGVWLGLESHARGYLHFVGILVLAVGLFWFVPGLRGFLTDLLNVNRPVAYLNILVGIFALLLARSPVRVAAVHP